MINRTPMRKQCANAMTVMATLAILFFAGMVAAAKKPATPEPALVWPPAPNAPRVSFVKTINRPADAGVKSSALARFGRIFTGSHKGNEPLSKPFGLAFDDKDNLCITDTGANVVCFYDRAANKWKRWDKVEKIRFASPVAVAKRGSTLFVADSALQSIIVFNDSGKLLFQITNKLERPSGLALSGDKLFVTDSRRHAVIVFDQRGKFVMEFGKRGIGTGEFNFPTHISADPKEELYVTDSMNSRIQVFSNDGRFLRVIGSMGNSTGQFSRPKGIAVDTFGHVYVVDGLFDNVQIFDGKGRFLLNLGQAGSQPGEFWLPNAIAIGRNNDIFIADSYNHRLQHLKYVGGP
jgi:DNA-binding beta-propeller fold protein YncE